MILQLKPAMASNVRKHVPSGPGPLVPSGPTDRCNYECLPAVRFLVGNQDELTVRFEDPLTDTSYSQNFIR